ncbi:tetratricopeptide repeat protein 29-like isoform X1 [Hydra vulgaris]|uniref:Tetratricopeptide repeat protein 29 n=2 Tax=Hydra vulgaris TaxID=6087 RepID=A0ABM4D513_HYDVU
MSVNQNSNLSKKLDYEKDPKKFHETVTQSLLVEILQEGYHVAFRELFNLLQNHKELGEQSENLLYIKEKLVMAEHGSRKGDFETLCESQLLLAKYFQEKDYNSLANLYYENSYQSSCRIKSDNRKKEAETVYYLGKFKELEQDYFMAQKHFEQLKSITKGCDWYQEGVLFFKLACECLQRIYIKSVHKLDHDTEKVKILDILNMAYLTAKEGGSSESLREVIYVTGEIHCSFGELKDAIRYYNEYFEISKINGDNKGIQKAYQALARTYQSAANIEKALEFFKRLLDEAERSHDDCCVFNTCQQIAALYNSEGNYELSVKFYEKALAISNYRNDECCRSDYAIALGNFMLTDYATSIVANNKESLLKILDWKCERSGFYPC